MLDEVPKLSEVLRRYRKTPGIEEMYGVMSGCSFGEKEATLLGCPWYLVTRL